jgi:hypothetical protein
MVPFLRTYTHRLMHHIALILLQLRLLLLNPEESSARYQLATTDA